MNADSNYVVSMIAPLPEADAFDAAEGIAPRLGLERDRLARLLSRRPGPITRPLERMHAERIAAMLEAVGVAVFVDRAWPRNTTPAMETPARETPANETPANETPANDTWVGFEAEEDVSAYDAGWHEPAPRRRLYEPTPYAPSDEAADVRREDEWGDVPEVRREERWDDMPAFDWNQPLGFARWRRSALLVVLALALAIFVWLQLALAPQTAQGIAADYERGLQAYRTGDFGRAMAVWGEAGSEGDPRALYMLGYMSEFGQGQAWSNRRASEYYRQAAERGSVRAQHALASLYERGLGVPQSQRTAVRWYTLAAENGYPEAQHRLALAYLQGHGVEQEWSTALGWFERAASAGMREAEAFVAVLRAVPQATQEDAADAF